MNYSPTTYIYFIFKFLISLFIFYVCFIQRLHFVDDQTSNFQGALSPWIPPLIFGLTPLFGRCDLKWEPKILFPTTCNAVSVFSPNFFRRPRAGFYQTQSRSKRSRTKLKLFSPKILKKKKYFILAQWDVKAIYFKHGQEEKPKDTFFTKFGCCG